MKEFFRHINKLFASNKKVAENYFSITTLQIAVILINLLLYPYLIRTLGAEVYGTYIFILSNVSIFLLFLASGFSFPALKKISLNSDNAQVKNQVVSEIFTAKVILYTFCAILLMLFVLFVPFVRENALLYVVIFSMMAIGDILLPLWYFQGMQKMSFVAAVNFGTRLLTIPLIFIFVKSPADLLTFVLIISVVPFFGSVFTFLYLIFNEKIKPQFISPKKLKNLFKDAIPFHSTTAFELLKNEGAKIIVGVIWGMSSVAIYDLANKIINLANVFTNSINTVLFPKAIKELNTEKIKKIFRYESVIGLTVSALIIAFGYWAILILGGKEMLAAYPLLIILSFTVFLSLMVGCCVNYIFVPQNRYYFVSKNQFISMIFFLFFSILGLTIYKNIMILALAQTLSVLAEVIYCKYVVKKHKLLQRTEDLLHV